MIDSGSELTTCPPCYSANVPTKPLPKGTRSASTATGGVVVQHGEKEKVLSQTREGLKVMNDYTVTNVKGPIWAVWDSVQKGHTVWFYPEGSGMAVAKNLREADAAKLKMAFEIEGRIFRRTCGSHICGVP